MSVSVFQLSRIELDVDVGQLDRRDTVCNAKTLRGGRIINKKHSDY